MDTITLEERLAYMQKERDEAIVALDAERHKNKEKLATAGKLISELKRQVDSLDKDWREVCRLATPTDPVNSWASDALDYLRKIQVIAKRNVR